MITLDTKLRNFRIAKKLSQQEVADKLDIQQGTYCNWEKGNTSPSVEYLTKLAEIFDIPVQDFFSQASILVQNQENKDNATIGGFNVGVTEQMLEKILAPLYETIKNQNTIHFGKWFWDKSKIYVPLNFKPYFNNGTSFITRNI